LCDLKSTELLSVLFFQKLLKVFGLCYLDSTNIKCQLTHSGVLGLLLVGYPSICRIMCCDTVDEWCI